MQINVFSAFKLSIQEDDFFLNTLHCIGILF